MSAHPRFSTLSDSTREDWAVIMDEHRRFRAGLADRVLDHLRLLGDDYGGFPVDRLQHSLQTAELAADAGEDEEYVVCALLHDVGDILGSANHPDVGAAILEPYVTRENHWMVKHHGIFQGYNFFHHIGLDRNMRDRFKGTPDYDRTEAFVAKYDDLAFDAAKPKLDLETFAPMVRRVFETPKHTIYQACFE